MKYTYTCMLINAAPVQQCKADFVDSVGDNCKKYVDEKWCRPNGGYGENWKFDEWGTFNDYEKDGDDARDCPGCGCGGRQTKNLSEV